MLCLDPSSVAGDGTGLVCSGGLAAGGGVLVDSSFNQDRGIRASGGWGAAGRRCLRFLLVRPVGVSIM